VSVREVAVIPGAKAGVAALIHASRGVGVVTPHWPGYTAAAKLFRKPVTLVKADPRNSWLPTPNSLEGLKGVDTVMVNYPNNPTGAVLDSGTLHHLLDVVNDAGTTLVSDETYRDIVFEGDELIMINHRFERTVSIYSFSKTYSLPGLRVGYVVGDPELVRRVSEFVAATYTSVPVFAQLAALKALEVRDEVVKVIKRAYRRRAKAFCGALSRKVFDVVEPRGAFYVFARIKTGLSGVELARRLVREGIGVFPGEAFGGGFRDYVRVALTAPEEVLVRAARVMNEVVRP